jgi:hypothetical protein
MILFSKLKRNTSDVTQPLKPTSQTAPFRLMIFGACAALLLPILYPLACNLLLPASDAGTVKGFFFDVSRVVVPLVVGGGGVGTVVSSVSKTLGKIGAQLSPGMVTDATPNGEGVGALAPISHLVARSGFDVRDFNIGTAPNTAASQEEDDLPDADSE